MPVMFMFTMSTLSFATFIPSLHHFHNRKHASILPNSRSLCRARRPVSRAPQCGHPPPVKKDASEKMRLPTSSTTALISCGVTTLCSLLLPLSLAQLDAMQNEQSLLIHLNHYSSHFRIVFYTSLFALLHSGLASLRPLAQSLLGERAFRLIFATCSIPSAVYLISYFISHRYDGHIIMLQSIPFLQPFVYTMTLLSFLFLYPATFNLLEIAAIQRPTQRIYETGIMRITRHPQLTGQVLWCIAHTIWLGSSFSATASLALIAHHLFGAWNGDRRLKNKHGSNWYEFASRTSILPFAAIMSGKQRLEVSEFVKPAYVGVILFVIGTYAAHPLMLQAVSQLHM